MQKVMCIEESDAEFYKNLCEALEQSERDFREGRFYDAKEVFKELRRKYNY